jgi:hypothetical protein
MFIEIYWNGDGLFMKESWMNDTSIYTLVASCYENQYNTFCHPEAGGICVDGQRSLNDNLADNIGIDYTDTNCCILLQRLLRRSNCV